MEALPQGGSPPREEVYTLEEYQGWWDRAEELHGYLEKMPYRISNAVGMQGRHQRMLETWEDLQSPDELQEVNVEDLAAIRSWIRDSENLIHYIVRERGPSGPTTPDAAEQQTKKKSNGKKIVSGVAEAPGVQPDWHWPWIEGWDDPVKRKRILNPPKKNHMVRNVLIVGGLAAGAVFIGKKMLE